MQRGDNNAMRKINDMKKNLMDSRITNSPCDSTAESRPLRGAKNRIQGCSSATADFLLEADKRGSPPKSEKRQLLARRGSGAGGAALLRKDSSESNTDSPLQHCDLYNLDSRVLDCFDFDKSKSRNDDLVADSRLLDSSLNSRFAQNDEKINTPIKRAGFGMMFAIILTILVATLGVLAVKFSTQTLNTTTNEYIAIQLDLYLNSTAELAILYVQRNGFVCEEGVDCNLGKGGNTGKRANVTASIEKYISYGANNEYAFKYKITPLDNYDKFDATEYIQNDDIAECEKLIADALKNKTKPDRCFKEETKNAFVLDISGSVANPITHQTLRVTKRQIIKP